MDQMQSVVQWTAVSGMIGVLLPVMIELFAKHIKGKKKIAVVFGCCLISSTVQYGVEGCFQNWNPSLLVYTLGVILTISINSWNQMWKKWFPTEPSPLPEPNSVQKDAKESQRVFFH